MDRETFREVQALLRPLKTKIMLVASRAVVSLIDDARKMQGAQVTCLPKEVPEPEHMQPGGLTHVPLPGAEGIYLTIGGVRDDGVLICVSDRNYRPKGLLPGETALYNDAPAITQSKILLKLDGSIEVLPAPGQAVKFGAAAVQAGVIGTALHLYIDALNTAIIAGFNAIAAGAGAAAASGYSAAVTAAAPLKTASLSTVVKTQ